MKKLFCAIAACLVALLSAPSKAANTWGTDMSDLWWNPAESGWGANIAHQQDVIFMTLFVYGPDSRVRWYVASGMVSNGPSDWYRFTGDLYETQGPWLGSFFNPNNVSARRVGTASFRANSINTGVLSYSVDGVSIQKNIERQTFRSNATYLAGTYLGALIEDISVIAGSDSGGTNRTYAQTTISLSGDTIRITPVTGSSGTCSYVGRYSQSGRMGSVQATSECTNGTVTSPVSIYEIEAGAQSVAMRFEYTFTRACCTYLVRSRLVGVK